MPHNGTPFPFPRLPAGVDAIRILTIEPGDFFDPLLCTLTPAAFSDRPNYVALSYTWGSSHPDNSKLSVSLNNAPSTSPNRLRSRLQTPPRERESGSTDQHLTDVLPRQRAVSPQGATSDPVAL